MFNTDTVLILGAGASVPYKYPTGEQLIIDIVTQLSSGVCRDAFPPNYSHRQIDRFVEDLRGAEHYSIDAFLNDRKDYLQIGKAAIISVLSIYEEAANFFENQSNWYKFIFNEIASSPDSIENKRLSIISFNYDRSLEYYLYRGLKSRFNFTDEQCRQKIEKLNIVHVHGRLPPLPCELVSNQYCREYTRAEKEDIDQVKFHIHRLKIFHEEEGAQEIDKKVQEITADAKLFYFLGFGFHKQNMKRLNITFDETRQFHATRYKMPVHRRNQLRNEYPFIKWSGPDADCLKFFTEYLPN